MSAKGGITKGKSHAQGGIPLTVKSTGQKVELEGGEGVINKKSMSDKTLHNFEGEKLTKCEIASKINSDNNFGVKINCDGVVGKKYSNGGNINLATINNNHFRKGGAIDSYSESQNIGEYQKALSKFLEYGSPYAVEEIYTGDYRKEIEEPLEELDSNIDEEQNVFQKKMLQNIKTQNDIIDLKEILSISSEQTKPSIKKEIEKLTKLNSFARGGKTSKNKIIIELTKTKDYPVYIGSKFAGKNYYKKGQVFESEFLMQFKNDKDIIVKIDGYNIPLKRNEFILHSKKSFNEGGAINKYDNSLFSKLSFEDKEIIETLNTYSNSSIDLTVEQSLFLSNFKGRNLANYLTNNISSKIWGLFFKEKPTDMLIENIYLINSGIGKLIANSSSEENIIINNDDYDEFATIEQDICRKINVSKTNWEINTKNFALNNCTSALMIEPLIDPTNNFMADANSWIWKKNMLYAISVCEFTKNSNAINQYTQPSILNTKNYPLSIKRIVINEGFKNVENNTIISIYTKKL